MSNTLDNIVDRVLKDRLSKTRRKVPSDRDVLITGLIQKKGMSLQGTIEKRGDFTDVESEEYLDAATDIAATYIEKIIEGTSIFEDSKDTHKSKIKLPTLYGVSDKSGKLISNRDLRTILNLALEDSISALMGTGGRLNKVTGRLSNSAEIQNIDFVQRKSADKKATVSLYFKYMYYPYEVFENSNHPLFTQERSPSDLIADAIKDLLRKYLSPRSFELNNFTANKLGGIHNQGYRRKLNER